jgi:hypothetical protein
MPVIVHNTVKKPMQACVDSKDILVSCSNCDMPLIYVWPNHPKLDIDVKIIANCCYCDDKSFPLEVHGGFGYRGYDRPMDNPENVRPIVNITNISQDGDRVTVETEKV